MKSIIRAMRSSLSGDPLNRSLRLPALCGAVFLLAGCASEPGSVVLSAPPPPPPASVPVYTAVPANPQPTAVAVQTTSGNQLVVMQAPPAAQQEVPSARPSSSHVWVAGYWSWRNNQYQWMTGQWVVPPRSGAVWIPPRWAPEGSSYRFYEGRWE